MSKTATPMKFFLKYDINDVINTPKMTEMPKNYSNYFKVLLEESGYTNLQVHEKCLAQLLWPSCLKKYPKITSPLQLTTETIF